VRAKAKRCCLLMHASLPIVHMRARQAWSADRAKQGQRQRPMHVHVVCFSLFFSWLLFLLPHYVIVCLNGLQNWPINKTFMDYFLALFISNK
jgi:hypothetical protein